MGTLDTALYFTVGCVWVHLIVHCTVLWALCGYTSYCNVLHFGLCVGTLDTALYCTVGCVCVPLILHCTVLWAEPL